MTVVIGTQTWMAENLRVARDPEGNPVQCWCYDNDEQNCNKYGRLYTWEAAIKACPKGWHLPSDEEWSL